MHFIGMIMIMTMIISLEYTTKYAVLLMENIEKFIEGRRIT